MGKPTTTPEPRQLTDSELDYAASLMQLLADQTRLGILAALLPGAEVSVGELAEQLERPLPAISQHLAKLRHGRLVSSRREGTSVRYRFCGEHVAALLENLFQHTEHELFLEPPHHSGERLLGAADARGARAR